jgi:DNA-binding GntR family transcriptional regulator
MGIARNNNTAARQPRAQASKPARGRAAARTKATSAADAPSSLRGEFVYAALRDEIRDGRLQPGDRLLETEIAERLGVSRTPVREALKRLESDGVVSFGQPRGLTVTKPSYAQILELYAMREVLEGAAARFAAERATPFEIESMKQILAQHDGASTPAKAADANRRLHAAIVAATHNAYLQRVMNVLTDALALLGTTTYSVPGRIASGWKENAEIVACIERRDASRAEEAGRRHIRAAAAVRIAMNAKG